MTKAAFNLAVTITGSFLFLLFPTPASAACCNGGPYCSQHYDYSSCQSDSSCTWDSVNCPIPTATPKPTVPPPTRTPTPKPTATRTPTPKPTPTRTPTPKPTLTPTPSPCCQGQSYCNPMSYSTCLTDSTCLWTCTVPTATPKPPTSTPIPTTPTPVPCCQGQSYCYSMSYSTCHTDSTCLWTCAVPTATPGPPTLTPAPACCLGGTYCYQHLDYAGCHSDSSCTWSCSVPTAIPKPNLYCNPGMARCTNTYSSDNYPDAYIETCTAGSTGPYYQITKTCPAQVCNSSGTDCIDPVIPVITLAPQCTTGTTKCIGTQKYICVNNQWDQSVDSTSCGGQDCCIGAGFCNSQQYSICSEDTSCRWTCPVPTPTPTPDPLLSPTPAPSGTPNFYDCIFRYNYAYCTQTNPLWAHVQLPYCYDGNTLVPNPNQIIQMGCGQSSTCSLLCNCTHDQTYCNVNNCIKSIPDYQSVSCGGTNVFVNGPVLQKYGSACYQSDILHPADSSVNPPQVTREQILNALKFGPVEIHGIWTDKNSGTVYNHLSIIVGISNGKFVFNDPLFNSQNTDPKEQITQPTLEDYFNIQYIGAISVKKK